MLVIQQKVNSPEKEEVQMKKEIIQEIDPQKSFVYGSLRARGHNREVIGDLIDTSQDGTIKAQMFHYADNG